MKEIKALLISGSASLLGVGITMIQSNAKDKWGYAALLAGILLAYCRELAKKWDVKK